MRARTMRSISLISGRCRIFLVDGVRMVVDGLRSQRHVSVAVVSAWSTGRHRQTRRGACARGRKSKQKQNESAEIRSASSQDSECVAQSSH